jgi:16S rRNA (adenine1518-N6/adenine1519-N6)-dimethyltransferase
LSSRLKARGFVPRKSLGQNFLTDDATAQRIVAAADISDRDLVFEVGPGTGALTRHLAAAAGRVIAVELDQTLLPILQEELGATSNVTLVHGDALDVDFPTLAQNAQTHFGQFSAIRFVANLPYYITSAAIRRILECGLDLAAIVLTVQLEVAQRIVAQPPDMSLLAVSVQFYGRPELLFRIAGGQFYPPPDVESAVLRITPHRQLPDVDPDLFFQWVKAGFSQPRKQLRNTLSAGLRISKPQIEALLSTAGIDPARRPESLGVEEWLALARSVMPKRQSDH